MVGNLLVWVQEWKLGLPCLAIEIAQQFLEVSTVEHFPTVHIGIAKLGDQRGELDLHFKIFTEAWLSSHVAGAC